MQIVLNLVNIVFLPTSLQDGQPRNFSSFILTFVNCGPMRVSALGRKEVYFATFIDDFSRMTWVYALEQKSGIFPAFQSFVAHAKRECAAEKVLTLRTDNAGEYVSIKMQTWCADHGIVLQTTQPYSPDMNGITERMMRSIVQDASAMLWGAHLGIPFWYEAVKTAVYLKNRKPHAAREKTPYELWTNEVPSLSHLRIFGCRCFALIPDKKRSKWESHSNKCLFIGYFSTHNLFRLYDLVTNTFIKRRDVIFHECVVGHHGFANVIVTLSCSCYMGIKGHRPGIVRSTFHDPSPIHICTLL